MTVYSSPSSQSERCAAIVARVSPIWTKIPAKSASSPTLSPHDSVLAIAVNAAVNSKELIQITSVYDMLN